MAPAELLMPDVAHAPFPGLVEPPAKRYDFVDWCYVRRDLWPGIFTLCLAAFYSPSVLVGLHLGLDHNTQYWFGKTTLRMVLTIPVLILICHVIHHFAARPRFWPFLVSTVAPAIITLIVGLHVFGPINRTVLFLYSSDCTTYTQKLQVDNAYRSAAALFDTCVQRVATSTDSTVEATASLIGLEDCSEYQTATEDVAAYSKEWAYLAELEETEACSGWCTPGSPSLWTRPHEVYDLCSHAAAGVMQGKALRSARRMLVLGMAQLSISVLLIAHVSNLMIKRNIGW